MKRIIFGAFIILLMGLAIVGQNLESPSIQPTQPRKLESPIPDATPVATVGSTSPTTRSPTGFGVMDWTTDTWTAIAAIVAFAALIQPWLLALWRKLFKRGTLDIHEAGLIEIGFSGYGSTIGLTGTLRALHKDMFVQWVKLRLEKEVDKSVQEFEWKAFRNPKLSIGTAVGESAEILFDEPFCFLVTPLQPHRYNILFSNHQSIEPALPLAQKLRQDWFLRIQGLDVPILNANTPLPPAVIKKLRRPFSDLSSSETYKDLAALLTKLNLWQAGRYKVTMIIQTARPNKHIEKIWSLTLPEEELEKLNNNISTILRAVCALPISAGEYGFSFVPYNS